MYTVGGINSGGELSLPPFHSIKVHVDFLIDFDWMAAHWTANPFVAIGFATADGDNHYPGVCFSNDGKAYGDDDTSNVITGLPIMSSAGSLGLDVWWDSTGIQLRSGTGAFLRLHNQLLNEDALSAGPLSDMKLQVWVWTGGGGQVVGYVKGIDVTGVLAVIAPVDRPAFWTDFIGSEETV